MDKREQLIELILKSEIFASEVGFFNYHFSKPKAECVANFLLENGVILPPCKVGDTVWIVFNRKASDMSEWFMVPNGVRRILCDSNGFSVETWNMGIYPKRKTGDAIFFTREEAEAELEKRRKEVKNE